jgi:hypothetical protein
MALKLGVIPSTTPNEPKADYRISPSVRSLDSVAALATCFLPTDLFFLVR